MYTYTWIYMCPHIDIFLDLYRCLYGFIFQCTYVFQVKNNDNNMTTIRGDGLLEHVGDVDVYG
jgi:hypothetical protein